MHITNANQGFYDVLEKRRTVRKFKEKPIEKDKLVRILQAGMKAPSHNHLREWHFLFLNDPAKRWQII